MHTIHCAICETKEKLIELYPATFDLQKITDKTFSARRTPDRMHYRFVRCTRCGLIFSSPILDEKKIRQLYAGSGFDYPVESEFLKKTYGVYLKKIVKTDTSLNCSLLDIGCGNGFFLEEALAQGITSVQGVEPGKSSVAKALPKIKKHIVVNLFSKKLFPNKSFDIVTCFHTLDHIVDVNSFLNDVRAVLNKNGHTLFVVHNTQGLSVKLFGEKSPIFDIEHIYLFNKKTLKRLFQKHGFQNIQVFDVVNTYHISYWIRMVPFPMVIKRPLLSLLSLTKIGNVSISLPAGNIGIIAQK